MIIAYIAGSHISMNDLFKQRMLEWDAAEKAAHAADQRFRSLVLDGRPQVEIAEARVQAAELRVVADNFYVMVRRMASGEPDPSQPVPLQEPKKR